MGRRPSWMDAVRSARADWTFRANYQELHDAAAAWQDAGDYGRLERALDGLESDSQRTGYPPLGSNLLPAERIVAVAARMVTVSQWAARMRNQVSAIEAERDALRDELAAALALAAANSGTSHHRKLYERLEAEGIVTADLHPVSRELAHRIAGTIRAFNEERRRGIPATRPEDYVDRMPLGSWAELPRRFAGFELVEIAPEDAHDDLPCPLPPSTDIAFYARDGRRPEQRETRRDTLSAWSKVMEDWCSRNEVHLAPIQRAAWAMLLAHWMQNDDSRVSNLAGLEMVSPWTEGAVVRVKVLAAPTDEM